MAGMARELFAPVMRMVPTMVQGVVILGGECEKLEKLEEIRREKDGDGG